jgi:hypothetical protein
MRKILCPLLVLGCDDSDNTEQALQVTALVMRCYKSNFMGSDLMASPIAKVHPPIPQGIICVQKQGGGCRLYEPEGR